MLHALPGDQGHIPGSRIMVIIMQAVGIGKMRACAAQLLGPAVHLLHESIHIAADHDGHDIGGVIGGRQHDTVEQVFDRDLLAGCQINRGRFRIRDRIQGFLLDRNDLVHGQFSSVNGFESQQGRHDLGRRCRIALFIRVLLIQDLAAVGIDQDRRLGVNIKIIFFCVNAHCG